jgi:hypothetical protein
MIHTPCKWWKSKECSIRSGELPPANSTTMTVAPTQMASRAFLLLVLVEHLRGHGQHPLLTASSTCRSGAAAAKDDIGGGGQSY